MVKIVCRRCQFRNEQYNLHCGNCGASLAPEIPGNSAVLVRNIWIGVLAGALLVVVAILVVQRSRSVPATETSAAGATAKTGAPPAGGAAAPARSNEIPMPYASSGPDTFTSDSSDPNCPPEEVAEFLANTESLQKEFTDGLDVVDGTSRLLLPTVVKDLQATRRSYASLGGPPCTRSAHASVEKAMTSTIDAILIYMRGSSDDVASMESFREQLARAKADWADARSALSTLK